MQIAQYLMEEANSFDLVSLQEVWVRSDFERLRAAIGEKYPYSFYFSSGIVGSGLVTFSRHRISQTFFKRFTLSGSLNQFWHGDWFSGKGIGGVRVHIRPNGPTVDFYNTHLHAEYSVQATHYTAHRLAQMQELVQFVENSTRPAHVTIVAGDLNTRPEDFIYHMIMECNCASRMDLPLVDAWRIAGRPRTALEADSYHESVLQIEGDAGYTFNVQSNSFHRKTRPQERLDYVLFSPRAGVHCESVSVVAADAPHQPGLSFSDHCALTAEFVVDRSLLLQQRDQSAALEMSPEELAEKRVLFEKASVIFAVKKRRVVLWQRFHLCVSALMFITFIGLTITTAITIPNDELTTLLILAFFAVQPIVLITAFLSLFMACLFLQEERAALAAFMNECHLWIVHHEPETESDTEVEVDVRAELGTGPGAGADAQAAP